MHRIIRVYSLLAVLLDPIVHVFLENTVYGVYTVHRIIRVYSQRTRQNQNLLPTNRQNLVLPGSAGARRRRAPAEPNVA